MVAYHIKGVPYVDRTDDIWQARGFGLRQVLNETSVGSNSVNGDEYATYCE
jgi:hypothetical protein